MSGVFISYASADKDLAMRVYNDLRRSGARAWRYELDGAVGADFVREVHAEIRTCSVFLLVDSPSSRQSPYVRDEVGLARDLASAPLQSPRFLMCTGREPGAWQSADELFPGQGTLRATVLNPYDRGIRELCAGLGFEYVPPFRLPSDQDFADELFGIPLHHATRQRLLDDYTAFRERYDHLQFDRAERKLGALIDDCEHDGIAAVTPYLALGALSGDMMNDKAAASAFERATLAAPTDPRGWAGLGGALYYAGNYSGAIAAYEESNRCIRASTNPKHQSHAVAVKVNLAAALTVVGRTSDALDLLLSIRSAVDGNPRLLVLLGHVLLLTDDPRGAHRALRRAEELVTPSSVLALGTWLDIADNYAALGDRESERATLLRALAKHPADADVHRRLGVHYAAMGALDHAERYLRRAVKLSPVLIAARAELASVLSAAGEDFDAHAEATQAVGLTPRSATDQYYVGLAQHILGDDVAATYARRLSRRDVKIARWPEYDDLLDRQL